MVLRNKTRYTTIPLCTYRAWYPTHWIWFCKT